MKKPFITVLIANYNGMKFLKGVLGSLKKQAFRDFEVIVVDDGSTDGSVKFIKKAYPWVRLHPFEKNQGFVKAQNYGIGKARGTWVVLLDNDTWFDKDWLGKLAAQAKKNPHYGVISAKIWDRDKVEFRSKNPTLHHTINLFGYLIWHDYKKLDEIDLFAVGSGFSMYKRSLFPNPPFDPDYKAYAADIAMCFLMSLRGYKIRMVDAITNHYGGGTFKNRPAYAYIDAEKNRVINILIHYQKRTLIKTLPLFLFSLLLHNLYALPRILYHLKAYGWIIANWGRIIEKRERIQSQRKVQDTQFTLLLSSKIFDERLVHPILRPFLIILNVLSFWYLTLVGIPTIEALCYPENITPR